MKTRGSRRPPLGGDIAGRRPRLRLDPWPGDPARGQVVVLEHDAVPSPAEIAHLVERARRRGYVALRTGALFPAAVPAFADAGFVEADTLVLLRRDLTEPLNRGCEGRRRSDVRVTRLSARHHRRAAEVDRLAFGDRWANDAAALADIRRATPAHRARRVSIDGAMVGFAISGAGDRTGYLQRIAVDPGHHRRGIATALVGDALAWMERRGATEALVNTGVDNAAALALYERLGFDPLPGLLTVAHLELPDGGRRDAGRTADGDRDR